MKEGSCVLLVHNANYVFPTGRVSNMILIVVGGNEYIDGIIIRFLPNSQSRPYAHIHWSNVLSNICKENGVKQGGVLCAIIFCVYFETLLKRLEKSVMG